MERQLLERMVGAGVLIAALVLIGPAILDGNRSDDSGSDPSAPAADDLQTHTVRLHTPAAAPRPAGVATAPDTPPDIPPQKPSSPTVPAGAARSAAQTTAPTSAATVADGAAKTVTTSPAFVARTAERPEPARPALSAQPPVKSQPPPSGSGWFVQVGTFGQRSNADRLVANLQGLGFAAVISTTDRSGKALHRVRVGPTGERAEAEALAARLAAAGHRGQLVAP